MPNGKNMSEWECLFSIPRQEYLWNHIDPDIMSPFLNGGLYCTSKFLPKC